MTALLRICKPPRASNLCVVSGYAGVRSGDMPVNLNPLSKRLAPDFGPNSRHPKTSTSLSVRVHLWLLVYASKSGMAKSRPARFAGKKGKPIHGFFTCVLSGGLRGPSRSKANSNTVMQCAERTALKGSRTSGARFKHTPSSLSVKFPSRRGSMLGRGKGQPAKPPFAQLSAGSSFADVFLKLLPYKNAEEQKQCPSKMISQSAFLL